MGDKTVLDTPSACAVPTAAPPLASRVVLLPRGASLVDSALAQAYARRRACGGTPSSSRPSPLKAAKVGTSGAKHHKRDPPVRIVSSGSLRQSAPAAADPTGHPVSLDDNDMCPYAYIETVLVREQRDGSGDDGAPAAAPRRPLHASLPFAPPTPAQVDAYDGAALAAVRANDLAALRALHRAPGGRQSLGCRNRYGESLLHAAARRADAAVVAFLLDDAALSPVVRDDYGRTPLHDACWRGRPAFDVVEALLAAEPRLAFVADVRGHKPFQYARREHWGAWNRFLARKKDLIEAAMM